MVLLVVPPMTGAAMFHSKSEKINEEEVLLTYMRSHKKHDTMHHAAKDRR